MKMTKEQEKVARQIKACWPDVEIVQDDISGPGNFTAKVPGRLQDVERRFPHPTFGVGIAPSTGMPGYISIVF